MSIDEIEVHESGWLREARHNPCLMRPVSAIAMLVIALVSFITMLLYIPSFVLGFLISPLARRSAWFIEFLYPLGLARWGHFFLVKSALNSKHDVMVDIRERLNNALRSSRVVSIFTCYHSFWTILPIW